MRFRIAIISVFALSVGAFTALSFLRGQERHRLASIRSSSVRQGSAPPPSAAAHLSQLNEFQKEALLSARAAPNGSTV